MSVDWAEVRLTKHLYSESESLDALYRPLAMPRVMQDVFDDVVHRIRVLWNQLRYPVSQRRAVTKKMNEASKENYILLVSHMLLLQAAHRYLVIIVNMIRREVGEDPVGVGTGSHLTPKRPPVPSPGNSLSPRRGIRTKKLARKKKKRGDSGKRRRRRDGDGKKRRKGNQWAVELSQSISQLKGVAPWVQDFWYRGEEYR